MTPAIGQLRQWTHPENTARKGVMFLIVGEGHPEMSGLPVTLDILMDGEVVMIGYDWICHASEVINETR